MFGLIVSGRLVQTDFQLVGNAQFLINIPEADRINHLVVFLTGSQPLPEGMGAAVYFSWPDPTSPPTFQYLGFINNAKPSAIFKIAKLKIDSETNASGVVSFGSLSSHHAQIGISVEPMERVADLSPAPTTEPTSIPAFAEFAEKMIESLYNYAMSFGISVPNSSDVMIPASALTNWYKTFRQRFEKNPYFWRS
nr:EOG090X0D82 [Triops cancriformis]